MDFNSRWVSRIIKLWFLLIGWISMNACAGPLDFGGTSWKEEALLHDGRTIIVERSMTRGGHGIAHQELVTDERITFTMPGASNKIVWADKFSEDIGSSEFNLMMLEVYKNSAYVLASPMGCPSYNKWGRPNPPYIVFKYLGDKWVQITLKELPPEFKRPNLVISSPDSEIKKSGLSLIPAEVVNKMNAGFKRLEYRTIIREPLSSERVNEMCEERVLYKGYWVLPVDPVARKIIDQKIK